MKVEITRKGDRAFAAVDGGEAVAVKIVWARPVTGRGREICIVHDDKEEVAMLNALDDLDDESRKIAEQELELRYLLPKIVRVLRTEANFGNRYWRVETDKGATEFLLRDPNSNVTYLTEDHLLIRDTAGNRFEIESLAALDPKSRIEVDRIL